MIGEEKGKAVCCVCVCVCVWRGKACWQCGKEKPAGLLEHSGRMPASFYATGTLWPALMCVVFDCVYAAELNNRKPPPAPACVHTVCVCCFTECETMCFYPAFNLCLSRVHLRIILCVCVWEASRWRRCLPHIQCDLQPHLCHYI